MTNLAAMRIAVFLDQSFPPDSRVENEAYSLVEAGHEVHLFSLNFKKISPVREIVNGIQVHRVKAGKWLYKLSALAYTYPFFHNALKPAIKAFIELVKPEALHVHDMLIARAVIDVNDKSFHLPLTLDLHENRPEILQFYPHLKKFPGKQLIKIDAWRKAQNKLIKRADNVVLVTPEAIDQAVKDTGEPASKFIAVPNTITPEIYLNYPIDAAVVKRFKKGFDIVYVGDTGLRRGLDTALYALELIIQEVPQAQLVVVGKSTEDNVLQSIVQERGLSAHVLFEGWQDVSLFPSYIKGAEVCISPLHRNLHHDTTLANKLFQYMAGERPVVVSDCPSQANIVNEVGCGLIHEAGNARQLAAHLLELYKNPTRARLMGGNGKKAILNKYNWKNTSQALIQHYANLSS
ncbi:glycosyltransferase family 4 protein [Roseivirga pacifica]|uniref:glycosyltransferase family 4 protein n=1 Tax=Roseivirga pacifica TaxID=1267423 RepID=UPI003BAEADAD